MKKSVASLYQAVELVQEIPPLLIGERCNPNGSRAFREALLAEDWDACVKIALDQEARGYVAAGFKAVKMRFGFGPADGIAGMRKNEALVRTVRQAIGSPVPPERKAAVREAPVREAVAGWIGGVVAEDLDGPRKQRPTARRVFERLRG